MQKTLLAVGVITAARACSLQGQQQEKRQVILDSKAIARAEELVNDIFKDEIAKAADPEARTALATYLIQQGDESGDDPAARYVLYRQARDLAILAGNTTLALSSVDKLVGHFGFKSFDLKASAVTKLVQKVAPKEPSKALTDITLSLIAEALDADNYAAAVALGKVAAEAAKKSQVVALVGVVAMRNAEIEAAQQKFSVLQPFVDRLQKNADDAEANLKMGEYFGLFKGKWDRAMPYLAKSKSEPLASLAKKDLEGPKEAKDQTGLADLWWDNAIKEPQPQQGRMKERAAFWYEKALPGLAGLSRTKAQKRIEQTAGTSTNAKPAPSEKPGLIRTLNGHTDEVLSLAISSDGRHALAGSVDNTMRFWDLSTGKELQTFRGHSKRIWGVAFVPGGRHVVSASWDATVRLWDMATGKSERLFQHPVDVNGVAISRDAKWMLTGCDDKHMRLWDLAKGEEVKKFSPHANYCYGCDFSPNGLLAASSGADRRAMVFELSTGKVLREVEQTSSALVVLFSADNKHLFTCGDSAAHMWNIETGKEDKRFEPGSGFVTCMALTSDGKRLITGGEDRLLRVWDVATGKELTRLLGHTATITAVAVTSDGTRVVSGQADGGVRLWGV